MQPGLLVAGSIALDTLEGPFGRVTDELGGSALYFALAASLIQPVAVVAPVGRADEPRVRSAVAGREVDLTGLSVLEAPTYRWRARQEAGRNQDLGSQDSIYDYWSPALPPGWRGWAFAGSMRPDRQLGIVRRLRASASLLAADAMLSYLHAAPHEVDDLLDLADWFFANESELRGLGGDPKQPEAFRREHGLAGLVVKRGARGVSLYAGGLEPIDRAAPPADVVDTTGAGDAMAGGLLAGWLARGGTLDSLPAALHDGITAARLTIEKVGLAGIAAATPADLVSR